MFTDLGKLTEKQGEQIEKIEVQVDDTADSIAKGTKELDEAKRLQASLRKKKLISLAIGIVILLVICIPTIIALTSNSSSWTYQKLLCEFAMKISWAQWFVERS